MSLNKNSVYCVMPRSSKPPDTCKWGGNELRGILKFSPDLKKQDLPLLLRVLHADVQFVTGSCLGPVWLHFWGGFYRHFLIQWWPHLLRFFWRINLSNRFLIAVCLFFNSLHPNISMHILHNVHHTFPKLLSRWICSTIKSFFIKWSIPLFLWLRFLIQGWYTLEKSVVNYS